MFYKMTSFFSQKSVVVEKNRCKQGGPDYGSISFNSPRFRCRRNTVEFLWNWKEWHSSPSSFLVLCILRILFDNYPDQKPLLSSGWRSPSFVRTWCSSAHLHSKRYSRRRMYSLSSPFSSRYYPAISPRQHEFAFWPSSTNAELFNHNIEEEECVNIYTRSTFDIWISGQWGHCPLKFRWLEIVSWS